MSIPEITVDKAKEHHDNQSALFVDMRDPDSFRGGHVPGAVHLSDDNVQTFISSTDRTRPVVIYCYHGNSSLGGAAYLLSCGFKEVYSMSGGFEAWRRAYDFEAGGTV